MRRKSREKKWNRNEKCDTENKKADVYPANKQKYRREWWWSNPYDNKFIYNTLCYNIQYILYWYEKWNVILFNSNSREKKSMKHMNIFAMQR